MKKSVFCLLMILGIILLAHPACADDALEGFQYSTNFSSWNLFVTMYKQALSYFLTFHQLLLDDGNLTSFATTCVTFSVVILAFKMRLKGINAETLSDLMTTIGIALSCGAIVLNTAVLKKIVVFCVQFPLQVGSFCMSPLQDGAGTGMYYPTALGADPVNNIESLFGALDGIFRAMIKAFVTLVPGYSILTHSLAEILVSFIIWAICIILLVKIYLGAIRAVVESVVMIMVSAVIAPFFGVLGIFPWTRKLIVSLIKTVFYYWLVIISNAIVVGFIVGILQGVIEQFVETQNGNLIFTGSTYLFMTIWMWLGTKLMAKTNSYVSQITEIRGGASPGSTGILGPALAAAGMIGLGGKGGALAKMASVISSKMKGGGSKSHSEKQQQGITR